MSNGSTTRRRWFQFGLATMLLAVTLVALLAWPATWTKRPFPFPGHSRPIKDIKVEFDFGGEPNPPCRLHITDPKTIESWVVSSLRGSKPIPPRSLIALGTMTIRYDDGSTDELAIFRPWGFWSHEGEQFLGDLSTLRDECRQAVQKSGFQNATSLVNEPMNWE